MCADRLADSEARTAALDCSRSFIVQAPAGSGKTGLLTQRFLRLLAQVTQPEEILAITFTRKAAAEMRSRIIGALGEASRGVPPAEGFARQVFDDASAALARDHEQGWRLLEAPMRLQIMTVDALNSRLVTAMPVTAGIANVRIVESGQLDLLYRDAVESLLDWLIDDGPDGEATRHFLWHIDANTERWRALLSGRLKTREQWLPQLLESRRESLQVLRERSEQALRQTVDAAIRGVHRRFPAALKREFLTLIQGASERLMTAQPDSWLAAPLPAAWPLPSADCVDFWQRVAEWTLTRDSSGVFRKTVNVNLGFPPGKACKPDKDRFCELLAALASVDGLAEQLQQVRELPQPHYSETQWQAIEALIRLLPNAAAELQRLMAERGVADYPALAARAIAALGDEDSGGITDLALHLDYRIQHILVDEMQDTSASQYRLLSALTAGWQPGDGRSLFCVGDPMQSIYRFRGADVSLFLRACEEGVSDIPLTPLVLSTNFRSATPIIDWVNQTFAAVMGDVSDRMTDTVEYSASQPRPDAPQNGMVQWHVGTGQDAPGADAVVAQIQKLQSQYPGETIGVLARSRAPLQQVLSGLQQAGIACQAVDMDRLTDLPEVIDLLSLTRALEHSGDRMAWLALLRSPWIGLSMADIDALLAQAASLQQDTSVILDILLHPDCIAHLDASAQQRLAHFLRQYRRALQQAATHGLRDRVEQLWCSLGGPALLTDPAAIDNAWHYLDALQQLEKSGQLDAPASLEQQLDELRVSRNTPDATVFAMTIYKSKGLEFDHVILPELQRRTRTNQPPPLFLEVADGADGAAVLFSTQSPQASEGKDPLHNLLWQREQVRAANELDRVLYVACTRARHTLHLFATMQVRNDGETLYKLPAGTLLQRFGDIARRQFDTVTRDETLTAASAGEASHGWLQPQHRRLSSPWQAPPMPTPRASDPRFDIAASRTPIEFDWAGSSARHVGTVVHGWLQRLAGLPDPAGALPGDGQLERGIRVALMQLGVSTELLDDAIARAMQALRTTVDSERGQWLLSNRHPDSAAELALGALVDGRVVRVVIDRLIRDETGCLWIVDYKTSRHEGGDLEGFFANECLRYGEQLQRYRAAVAAYFAAQGRDSTSLRLALFFTHYGRLQPLDTAR